MCNHAHAALADVAEFLGLCQCAGGGFGGGPGQLAHLAPTYAAVAALAELGGPAALGVVDRPAIARFLTDRCVPPELGGGFSLCEGGPPRARCDGMCCMPKTDVLGGAWVLLDVVMPPAQRA